MYKWLIEHSEQALFQFERNAKKEKKGSEFNFFFILKAIELFLEQYIVNFKGPTGNLTQIPFFSMKLMLEIPIEILVALCCLHRPHRHIIATIDIYIYSIEKYTMSNNEIS